MSIYPHQYLPQLLIFQVAMPCVYIKDINSKYVFFSKNFQNLVGSNSSLEIGKSDYDLWDNRLATAFRKDDLVVLKNKEPTHIEVSNT